MFAQSRLLKAAADGGDGKLTEEASFNAWDRRFWFFRQKQLHSLPTVLFVLIAKLWGIYCTMLVSGHLAGWW
jgi:hypothetical protein